MSDLILYNLNAYTLDDRRRRATALAIRDGQIAAVGTEAEARAVVPYAHLLDLGGRTVLPGLIDAHAHFEWYSLGLRAVDAETATLAECLERVRAKAAATPAGQWITGHGWNQNLWGGFPTAADLDAVAPGHPVYLRAKSGHAGWANTAALRRANLTAGTPDPAGGQIGRDAAGQPTGLLFEEAMGLIDVHIPPPTEEELADLMRPAMEQAWRWGLTGVHDFDGRRSLAAWQILRERGQLGLRVVKTIRVAYLEHAIALGLRSGFGDDWIRLGNVKVFLDGALGPRTARMLAPYEGEPENTGITVTDPEEFYEQAARAAAHGLAMTTHAIGDKANHDLLNVYARLRDSAAARGGDGAAGQPQLRHRCEHVQVLHPDDYPRLGQLNVVASMQPIHATSDMLMADQFWGARAAGAYAWRTQLAAGAVLAFGSDAPVESLNPFLGLHAAVTRRRADGSPGPDGWYPPQRLSV
ncbi:MAG: amidohydrolase, partial [Anaerolineales bacterium]|nr:amidohydrolase [Anaerolineales bacterium]